MSKIIPRTELLQWLKGFGANVALPSKLETVLEKLKTGRILTFEEAVYASRAYENYHASPGSEEGIPQISAEDHSEISGIPSNPVSESPGRQEVRSDAEQLESKLLAGGEHLEHNQAIPEVGAGTPPPDDNPQAPEPGSILGAYRLATDSGFVVFVATAGLRGPDLRIGVGLGLPGDMDLIRVLEHGKVVNIDNILELCKWTPPTT